MKSLIFYPGLTNTEKELISRNPSEALKVFRQKQTAESSADKYFPDGKFNDESDAYRHYVWACLLVKELGSQRAQVYLDAHENNPRQPEVERAMDLANNRGGILGAQRLQSERQLDLTDIERAAIRALREKNSLFSNLASKFRRIQNENRNLDDDLEFLLWMGAKL